MPQQKSVTTGAIVTHAVEIQQDFQTGLDGGLYGGGFRFK